MRMATGTWYTGERRVTPTGQEKKERKRGKKKKGKKRKNEEKGYVLHTASVGTGLVPTLRRRSSSLSHSLLKNPVWRDPGACPYSLTMSALGRTGYRASGESWGLSLPLPLPLPLSPSPYLAGTDLSPGLHGMVHASLIT